MRITENMRWNTMVNSLFTTQTQYSDIMEKAASMKRVNRASDDPVAATRIIEIRQGLAANKQYVSNADQCDTWISVTESKLSGAYDLMVKAREIAVGQATATANASTRKIAAQNVQAIIDEMAGLANAKIGDRCLFSGSRNGVEPFATTLLTPVIEAAETAQGNAFQGTAVSAGTFTGSVNKTYVVKITQEGDLAEASCQVSTDGGRTWGGDVLAMAAGVIDLGDGVTLAFDDAAGEHKLGKNDVFVVNALAGGYYRGNDAPQSLAISRGSSLDYNITGAEAFTAAGSEGVDVFATLVGLRDALDSNDAERIFGQIGKLQDAQNQILLNQSRCGTKASQVESAKNSLLDLDVRLTSLLSQAQDSDLAEVAISLSMKELALNATYRMAAKISETTILNFFK